MMKKAIVLLACLFLVGCQIKVENLLSNEGHVDFGTGYNDSGITGKTNIFNKNQDIFIEINTSNEFGTNNLTITTYMSDKNGNEELISRESVNVDPSWSKFWSGFSNPNGSGKYIVRVYKGEDKIAEGSFQIK